MHCPFCRDEVPEDALVCHSCGRDIAVPPSLLAERDDLLKTRNALLTRLQAAHAELAKRPGFMHVARRIARNIHSS